MIRDVMVVGIRLCKWYTYEDQQLQKWMKMENYVNALRERAMGEMISIGQQFEFISIRSINLKSRDSEKNCSILVAQNIFEIILRSGRS